MKFSLRVLFLVVLVTTVFVGVTAHRAKNQQRVANWIINMGGDYHFAHDPNVFVHLGLQGHYVESIVSVSLEECEVKDLSPLALLPHLERLDLAGSNITDLTAIAGITSLEVLDLSYSNVSDVTSLQRLKRLNTLALRNCIVTELGPVSHLKKLEVLDVVGTSISDYSPLDDVGTLTTLMVTHDANISSLDIPGCDILFRYPSTRRLDDEN